MSETEAIESSMVTRRVRQAQKKIEGQVTQDLPAESEEQWVDLNCRQ